MNISHYINYDAPVPYKGLMIYPISVKDYAAYSSYSSCLTLDKNSVPDAKIISMSYLEYLLYMSEQREPYLIWLDVLLSVCLRNEKEYFEDISPLFGRGTLSKEDIFILNKTLSKYRTNEKGKAFLVIGEREFSATDFEEIKNIICEQNMIDIPDENISKEVRDSLDQAKAYKEKLSGSKPGSFEDYLISLAISTNWSFEYIYNLSVRRFIKSLQRLDNLIHYKIYLGASMSGMVEFKDKSFIKHWLTSLDVDNKYSDVEVNLDAMQNKLDGAG